MFKIEISKLATIITICILVGGGLLVSTIILANQNHQKKERISNLLEENNKATDKVASLEQDENKGEKALKALNQSLQDEKEHLEGELRQRERLIQRLAIRLSSTAVVNETASMAISDGIGRANLGNIFSVNGEESSAFTDAEAKKLNSIAKKIWYTKEVVVK
ncbi:MAG: hypothetical protein Q7R31_01775 [Candidatus Levybacteria bacterium]|nr:hypothetical protein [Candidatus Levybacteria bacterium]